MKQLVALICILTATFATNAQQRPVKVVKNANHFYYYTFDYGKQVDTTLTLVETDAHQRQMIIDAQRHQKSYTPGHIATGNHIPGYSVEEIFVDEVADSVYTLTTILANGEREQYRTATPYTRHNTKFDTAHIDGLTRYTCSINSNTLEFYVQPYPRSLNPMPQYGRFDGLVVSYWRNGQCRLQLAHSERKAGSGFYLPTDATPITARQLSTVKQQRMVIATRVFDNVQLCWGKKKSQIEGHYLDSTPYDSVLHFAGGTLALKRLRLPVLPQHYQTFIELHQHSNGDAYDRTGSVFVVPTAYHGKHFLEGLFGSPDSLPLLYDRNGERYQGIACQQATDRQQPHYEPPVELMRFFTSFGVNHFNSRVQIDGLEWETENYYKQEVTDLSGYLQGDDVWIGIWIGNYDKGGHRVTLDLKSYPNDHTFDTSSAPNRTLHYQPLFNTCNVLEMAGQNYGKLFGTDSLTVEFTISEGTHPRLRYISTGHGGWHGGDEFNAKPNSIIIDGKLAYTHTPWRCDCGRYREWNPVSGNFWNGMSSSDFSRSGWCPGTATQPIYFDLSHLSAGTHTLTIAIPQGAPQEGSFSHWAVSGIIIQE